MHFLNIYELYIFTDLHTLIQVIIPHTFLQSFSAKSMHYSLICLFVKYKFIAILMEKYIEK